ncbi:maltose operon protein [Atopomonas hussainii]|uniref:Maltose operon protein n=1 Tax=Atopomonas hussainii TaxID=1429083 RepID=A0A1H7JQ86_9GAMM|nr:MalM family protein [Atopomonas hussainii]SEK76811.1 maltose operon protein [Atopomonas hussainii]
MKQHFSRLPLLLAACTALLAGCASEPTNLRQVDAFNKAPAPLAVSAQSAQDALRAASVCCDSLQSLPFTQIAPDFSGNVIIDRSAPAFNFDSGKSFFRAFALPQNSRSFEIRLYSQAGDTVLAPNAMLLNGNLQITRLLGKDDFQFVPAQGLKGDSLDARLRVDRLYLDNAGNEAYLVLYTSDAQMAGKTIIEHPAKSYAKARGTEPPNIADLEAKHVPEGIIKMVVIEDKVAGQIANTYVPPRSIGQEMGNTVPSLPPPPVQPETKAFYRQAIDAALANRDLEKALRLADEAARVGDDSAKPYLLEKVQIK